MYKSSQAAHFISLEGIEGVGKSTAMQTIEQVLTNSSITYVKTREPGGTKIAEKSEQFTKND